MGFFDQRPVPPPPEPPEFPAWAQPESVLPGVVADTLILARTGDVVITLGDLHAYPNGFAFALTAYVREAPRNMRAFGPAGFMRRLGQEPLPDDLLRFGLRFADGTVLTNLDFGSPGHDDAGPKLLPQGGHGGRLRHEQAYWVWPLPPAGPIDVVCEWPAQGIAETIVTLDADTILTAAANAIPLF
jgi:hypothetical protein